MKVDKYSDTVQSLNIWIGSNSAIEIRACNFKKTTVYKSKCKNCDKVTSFDLFQLLILGKNTNEMEACLVITHHK